MAQVLCDERGLDSSRKGRNSLLRAEGAVAMSKRISEVSIVNTGSRQDQILNAVAIDVGNRQRMSEAAGAWDLALQKECAESVVEENVIGIGGVGVGDVVKNFNRQVGSRVVLDEVARNQGIDAGCLRRCN